MLDFLYEALLEKTLVRLTDFFLQERAVLPSDLRKTRGTVAARPTHRKGFLGG
jgi:hypothetical protein